MSDRINPPLLLFDDWFCGEVHIVERLKQKLFPVPIGDLVPVAKETIVQGVITESGANFNRDGYPCPAKGLSPIIIVRYGSSPFEIPRPFNAENEPSGEPQVQEFLVWVGIKLTGSDCNGEIARRKLGPIFSRIMGSCETRNEQGNVIRPRRPGILHGYQTSTNHSPLLLTAGPNQLEKPEDADYIFFELAYQCYVSFDVADDPTFER